LAADPDPGVRAAAASALVQSSQGKHSEQVIPAMVKLLQDKDEKVVKECLRSQWGQYSSPELDELYIRLSRDPRYRHDAIYFCLSTQMQKSPAICRRLVEALDDGDGRAAWGLTYGVGKDARALVEEGLLKALPEETNSYTREQEFQALKDVASAKSWKYLKLVADSDEEPEKIKQQAREILEKLDKDGMPIKPALAPGIK
jgi:HEAT repeat protein